MNHDSFYHSHCSCNRKDLIVNSHMNYELNNTNWITIPLETRGELNFGLDQTY